MTLYVGTTAGAYDLGMARIRKAPIAGTFYIGEESEIQWEATCYLTVVADVDIWAKHINVVDDDTFYMDGDITYTDQNHVFNPVPIMGSHRVLKLTGASISTQYDFGNSYCLGSSVTGYSVSCSTASSISGATTATPTLTFDTEGTHMVVLTVTAANDKTSVGIRFVHVYSKDVPATEVFRLDNCSGDYDTGGWAFTLTMHDQIDLLDVPERTLCILFAEEYYDGDQVSIGQVPGCENIIAIGRISSEAIEVHSELSQITLNIQGSHYWMAQTYAFPTGVILTEGTPTNWAEMQSPSVDEVLFRLLYWGSTVIKVMDVYLTDDTRIASELVSPASNLWAQIQEIAFSSIQARSGVDRLGRLFVEVEPQVVPVSSRSWPTVMTLTTEDWHETVRMQRVIVSSTGMVNLSGVSVSTDGEGSALFSLAPGHVFKRYGVPDTLDRLLLSTQNLSNQLAGLILGWRNNPFPNNEFQIAANNRMIDCFPRQRIVWAISASDTPRGFSFNSYFIPRQVSLTWDAETGLLSTFLSLEMETSEHLSMDGDIPGDGDTDNSRPPSPPAFPDLPDFPTIGPTDIPGSDELGIIIHSTNFGLLFCEDVTAGVPLWETINGGLTSGQYNSINWVGICPNGVVYAAYVPPAIPNNAFLARAAYPGAPFVMQFDCSDAGTNGGDSSFQIWGVAVNPTKAEEIGLIIGGATKNMRVGANGSYSTGAVIGTVNTDPDSLSYGLGFWINTRYDGFNRISASGGSVTPVGSNIVPWHLRAGTTGITYHQRNAVDEFRKGEDNLNTITTVNSGNTIFISDFSARRMDCDPTGQYLMTRGLAGGKAKSSDYGSTWSALASLPAGQWWFAYVGDTDRWVAAGGTSVRLTEDFGVNWAGAEGNIVSDFSLININLVRWVP
jgi:hypothetical protein